MTAFTIAFYRPKSVFVLCTWTGDEEDHEEVVFRDSAAGRRALLARCGLKRVEWARVRMGDAFEWSKQRENIGKCF